MPEACVDCKTALVFDIDSPRVRYECSLCERPLCARCGVRLKDGQMVALPCRRCKSEEGLLGEGGETNG